MRQKLYMTAKSENPLNPCQLKKLWGSGLISCSFDYAIHNNCPVFYVDSHNMPILGIRRAENGKWQETKESRHSTD